MTEAKPPAGAAPRGPYQNGIRRRREIIESASRVFASYGFTSGSLRQIADEVGVTPARGGGVQPGRPGADRAVPDLVGRVDQTTHAGDTVEMSDDVIVAEVRSLFATMDGLQLQWLLDPGIDPDRNLQAGAGGGAGAVDRAPGRPAAAQPGPGELATRRLDLGPERVPDRGRVAGAGHRAADDQRAEPGLEGRPDLSRNELAGHRQLGEP